MVELMAGTTQVEGLAADLEAICPGGVFRDVALAHISRWRIGGTADLIVRPQSTEDLARLRAWLHARGLAHVVIGATSNLLFSDAGLRAICVQIGDDFTRLSIEGETIIADAGIWVPGLARAAMLANLTGIEHICGIPGTLGGLVCMNGGTQRRGIGENVVTVTSVAEDGSIRVRPAEGCGFAYRRSMFQTNGEAITETVLRLQRTEDRDVRRREMLDILASRRRKFPRKQPNCGSVFVSNPAMYADYGPPGALIERLGFKGRRTGDAMVSPHHANFIVNAGKAKASEVLSLISEIRQRVRAETGYLMEVEARLVSETGAIVPAGAPVPDEPRRATA